MHQTPCFTRISLVLLCCPFSVLGSQSEATFHLLVTFSCLPLVCDSFLDFPCFLMTLRSLESIDEVFYRMSLNLGSYDVYLWLDRGMNLGKKNHKLGKMTFSSYPLQGTCCYDLSSMMLTWLAGSSCVCRVSIKYLFPPFSYCALWKQVNNCTHTPGERRRVTYHRGQSIYINYSKISMGKVCLFTLIYLFIYSILYFHPYGAWMFLLFFGF